MPVTMFRAIGGIGEKGAKDFINEYGSIANFTNQAIFEKSIDLKKVPKKFRAIVEDEEKAILINRNVELMNLRTTARPEMQAFQVDKGTPDAAKFQQFCEILLFKSIIKDFDNWISVFPHFRNIAANAA